MKLKDVFEDKRIVGLAGDKNTGKTNNLMALLKDFRQHNKTTPIYVYGLEKPVIDWLKKLGNVFEVSTIEQLTTKKNALLVIDEFQKLKLGDRRYTEQLNKFVDFIYHSNNWAILSSPSLREFNGVIGSKIERWLLKSVSASSLVNGSQLKEAVLKYNGRYKGFDRIDVEPGTLLIINDDYEKDVQLEYIKEADTKKENVDIFVVKK